MSQVPRTSSQGEGGEMSDQPKPTTGEWSVNTVARLFDEKVFRSDYPLYEDTYQRIASVHNAALAAESQKWQRVWTDRYETLARTTQQLRKQLADERSKYLELDECYRETLRDLSTLRSKVK
jgi:hypothetical protein